MDNYHSTDMVGLSVDERVDHAATLVIEDVMMFLYNNGLIVDLENDEVVKDFTMTAEIIKGAIHRSYGRPFYIHPIVNAISGGAAIVPLDLFEKLTKQVDDNIKSEDPLEEKE